MARSRLKRRQQQQQELSSNHQIHARMASHLNDDTTAAAAAADDSDSDSDSVVFSNEKTPESKLEEAKANQPASMQRTSDAIAKKKKKTKKKKKEEEKETDDAAAQFLTRQADENEGVGEAIANAGKKEHTVCFSPLFVHKVIMFTKPGPGQIYRQSSKRKSVFLQSTPSTDLPTRRMTMMVAVVAPVLRGRRRPQLRRRIRTLRCMRRFSWWLCAVLSRRFVT